jgi:hypothetical protein
VECPAGKQKDESFDGVARSGARMILKDIKFLVAKFPAIFNDKSNHAPGCLQSIPGNRPTLHSEDGPQTSNSIDGQAEQRENARYVDPPAHLECSTRSMILRGILGTDRAWRKDETVECAYQCIGRIPIKFSSSSTLRRPWCDSRICWTRSADTLQLDLFAFRTLGTRCILSCLAAYV